PLFFSIAVTKWLVCETWLVFHAAAPPENRPFSRSACTHGPVPVQPPNQHSVLKLIASIAPLPLGGARTALRLRLHEQSCLEAADAMTGHQFEFYYARLLECLGWTRIQVIGEKSGGDGGADI